MKAHKNHYRGTIVDGRPIRKDKAAVPVTITDVQHDRDATALLIASFFAHKNLQRILFNDSAITGVHHYDGHDNHFHVQTDVRGGGELPPDRRRRAPLRDIFGLPVLRALHVDEEIDRALARLPLAVSGR